MFKLCLLWLSLILASGCAENIEHDTALASKRAIEFAEATFVRGNLDQGYSMLAANARSYVPMNVFADRIKQMHPSGRPNKIFLLTVTPVSVEKIVKITLRGEGDGHFLYNVAVVGTKASDYHITTFGGGPNS